MGLFDRFKKRFKKTTESEITAEEDSTEAGEAVEQGRRLKEALDENKPTSEIATPSLSSNNEEEWDDSKDQTGLQPVYSSTEKLTYFLVYMFLSTSSVSFFVTCFIRSLVG